MSKKLVITSIKNENFSNEEVKTLLEIFAKKVQEMADTSAKKAWYNLADCDNIKKKATGCP